MRILLVCNQGQNRSKYLAQYLGKKGYDTDYGGIDPQGYNPLRQEQIDNADIIIAVRKHIRVKLTERYNTRGKRLYNIEVKDNPIRYPIEAQRKAELSWTGFQEEYVYPELRKQVDYILKDF